MFKILSLCALLALCFSTANALFEEDAGQLDFLVASTGHGHTAFGQGSTAAVISSDSTAEPWVPSAQETSCYVASRSVDTGSLLWRRNVCAADSDNKSHVTVVSAGHVITTDLSGIVRGWEIETGNLVWDTLVPTSKKNPPALWIVTKDSQDFVAVVGSEFALLEAATGTAVESPTKGEAQSSKPASIKATEAFCSSAELLVTVDTTDNSLHAFRSDKGKAGDALQLTTDFELEDAATGLFLLSCEANAASILVASSRGTTTHLTLTVDGPNVHAVTTWTAQEGLGQISSALMLDASHYVGELTEAKEEKLLEFSARLESQWKSLTSIFSPQSGTGRRDHAFGFVKIAVLLSQSSHRVFGMDTAGTARAEIRYQVDLPEDAEWHKMVHGTANSQQSMHGIHGGTHTREVLILSSVPSGNGKEIHWTCLDGTNGDIHAQGSVAVSSSVAQIAPLVGAGSCRQSAVLVLQDRSLAVIPGDDATNASVKAQIEATPNGFYSHVIDKKNSGLESLRIAMTGDELVAQPVGFASFPGEEIVTVAYPSREEVVESSCNVLGDDSILLKYLNPHLAVLVTMSTAGSELDKFSSALKRSKAGSQKRKPAGVKQGDVAPPSDDAPNLFVNVVDSVSGRVLYRASHANAISTIAPIALVSENWVFYTFMNEKTRRAEIGVLSLYEGMIGSDALTAFSTPEQIETFSSLDARESKPVVLAKTYAISKPATALGMTSTLGGISNRRLLIAGIDNRITAVERKLLGKDHTFC